MMCACGVIGIGAQHASTCPEFRRPASPPPAATASAEDAEHIAATWDKGYEPQAQLPRSGAYFCAACDCQHTWTEGQTWCEGAALRAERDAANRRANAAEIIVSNQRTEVARLTAERDEARTQWGMEEAGAKMAAADVVKALGRAEDAEAALSALRERIEAPWLGDLHREALALVDDVRAGKLAKMVCDRLVALASVERGAPPQGTP